MSSKRLRIRGLAGLDALILLIAVILIAIVIAAALLQTNSGLVNRGSAIENEKRKNLQSPLMIDAVRVDDDNGDRFIDAIVISARLREGSYAVPMNTTVILFDSKVFNCTSVSYSLNESDPCAYSISYAKKGPEWSADYLSLGDMILIRYNGTGIKVGQEDYNARVTLVPEHGIATALKLRFPPRILNRKVMLYPLEDF
jgi:archaellin